MTLTDEQQGVVMFIQVLAATLCQVDRKPDAQWTTAALRRYLAYVLEDVGRNQDVPETHLAHAQALQELLVEMMDDLQAEMILEPLDPSALETES